MTQETTSTSNGINVPQLVETIQHIQDDPTLASFTFRANSSWQNGTHSIGRIRTFDHQGNEDQSRTAPFEMHGDEPPILLGNNKGPNAVELLLQSLAFCYSVGMAANAAAQGIELTTMDIDVEGDADVHSFLGLDGTRAGFSDIRATVTVSSPNATEEQLQGLFDHVLKTSPVGDNITNPVPV